MVYIRRYRRGFRGYRRASRILATPGSTRVARRTSGREFRSVTLPIRAPRKVIHFLPVIQEADTNLVFTNADQPVWVGPGGNDPASPASCYFANNIPQGFDLSSRTANQAYMRHIAIRGVIRPTLSSPPSSIPLCLMVVYDRDPNGQISVPTLTDILDSGSVYGMQKVINRDRFEILFRKYFMPEVLFQTVASTPSYNGGNPPLRIIENYSAEAYGARNFLVDLKIPLNRRTVYIPGVTTVGNPSYIDYGALYIYTIAGDLYQPALKSNWIFNGHIRLAFTDMD